MQHHQQLEIEWARFNDLDPVSVVACSSGTAALHLALEALELPRGSEVITSDFNMVAVPRAIVMAGMEPVFVDCDERLCMQWSIIPPRINNNRVSAVVVVHIYGRRAPMEQLQIVAKHRGPMGIDPAALVEDLAEAHGVRPHPSTDAACWSFYQNKIVAGEEGGAVWFRDPDRAKLARQLRCLGFTDAHDFNHIPRGHNYRLADCLAEKVLHSLNRYKLNVEQRRLAVLWADNYCPAAWRMPARDANWVYDFRVPGMSVETQNAVVEALRKYGARHAFKPMSAQAEWAGRQQVGRNALRASREVVYLPLMGLRSWEYRSAFEIAKMVVADAEETSVVTPGLGEGRFGIGDADI